MKIALINGSPKPHRSASGCVLNYLTPLLEQEGHSYVNLSLSRPHVDPQTVHELSQCDAFIFVLPLYVDGLPSHLVSRLMQLEASLAVSGRGQVVYAVVQCGFYEGHHARWALKLLENWCSRTGLCWGYGLGFGGGAMLTAITKVPLGSGPTRSLARALKQIVASLGRGEGGENIFATVDIPRLIYKQAAEMGWRLSARSNGLKVRQLYLGR